MLLASALGTVALLFAASTDVMQRIIPNRAVVLVALAGIALRWEDGPGALLHAILLAAAIFAAMLVLFQFEVVGGGDVKLLAAASLLSPPEMVPGQMLLIALAGGGLALLWIVDRRLRGVAALPVDADGAGLDPPAPRLPERETAGAGFQQHGLPYGVAICLGTLASMALSS